MDLTKIDKPFGLLDAETQKALKEHGGPYEFYGFKGWTPVQVPKWLKETAYRVYPEPTKPREWYLNIYEDESTYRYRTRHEADTNASSSRIECILVREVL